MSTNTNHKTRKSYPVKVFALLLVTVCVTTAGAVILTAQPLAWFAPSITRPAGPATVSTATPEPQGQAETNSLQAELITLRPTGFEPAEMALVKGRFLLVVNNHSELPEIDLRLMRVTGARLHEVRVPGDQIRWSEVVDLHPGNYVLTEANHPEWVCRITVAPH